uniref:uncharacterized protein LOC124067280 isoform X2 n=1 Tax=Scatophagus argus TaxID=75038 RepID=UPI001ED81632|nr:uncharacterized protein LOC124067280 isoform X2 [Scatophagus argus]
MSNMAGPSCQSPTNGDAEMMTTVTGVLNGSVLLPCTCSERNEGKGFQWQMEEPNKMLVFKYDNTTNKGRATIFLPENSSNCSLLLTNITANDMGKYRCSFHSGQLYKKVFVYLNISVNFSVCQNDTNLHGENVLQCDAEGPYAEAEIQWNYEGRLLRNSFKTHITYTNTRNATTGLYHFTSSLISKHNWTSKPTCNVMAKGISTVISDGCKPKHEEYSGPLKPEDFMRYPYVKLIPIMSVFGFSLLLWWRWKLSQ